MFPWTGMAKCCWVQVTRRWLAESRWPTCKAECQSTWKWCAMLYERPYNHTKERPGEQHVSDNILHWQYPALHISLSRALALSPSLSPLLQRPPAPPRPPICICKEQHAGFALLCHHDDHDDNTSVKVFRVPRTSKSFITISIIIISAFAPCEVYEKKWSNVSSTSPSAIGYKT